MNNIELKTTCMTAENLVSDTVQLMSLPDIFMQVNEMMSNPRYMAADIGEVIARDAGLTARLLKIVNSALYGFRSEIDSISRAITIVGLDDLHHMILATSAVDSFSRIPNELVDMTDFWMQSVYCGITARMLAKRSSLLPGESLFVAGLLHDIGSLVMYRTIPDACREVLAMAEHDRRLIGPLQQEIIGFTYADVGAELIKKWKLPESLVCAIGNQLDPERATDHSIAAHIVYLSSRLSMIAMQALPVQGLLEEIPQKTLEIVGLSEGQISDVMDSVPEEFTQVFELIVPQSGLSH